MVRPRNFDEATAVASAMALFWKNGFQGVSLSELETATGLNRSSLYNTFEDKLGLFCRALDAYSDGPCAALLRPFRHEQGATALQCYLSELSGFANCAFVSNGCLMVKTDISGPEDNRVAKRLEGHFDGLHREFTRAYRRGLRDGTVNSSLRPKDAADWLQVFARGLMAAAASGEKPARLQSSIQTTSNYLFNNV